MAQPNIEHSSSGRVVSIYKSSNTPCVLAVDDDRSLLELLSQRLGALNYDVLTADGGDLAFQLTEMYAERIDAILLDRMMPGIDGLEVVRMLKAVPALANIPVIMQTAADAPEQIREGIEAGVFYYLTKPINPSLMQSVLASAIEQSQRQRLLRQELQQHNQSFQLMESARFEIKTIHDAQSLSAFIANAFHDPARSISGLAELMINAVEHGNLGIGYDEKTLLVERRNWMAEIEQRLLLPENQHKTVEVIFKRKADGNYIQITDQGAGFEWKSYLSIDPSRATDNHGRGIARANQLSFDGMKFNDKGNQVIAFVRHGTQQNLDW